MEHALEHDLGLGGNRELHRPARNQLHRFAQQRARNLELVAAEIDIHLGGQQHCGVVADGDRELQRLSPRLRLLGQDVEVMVGGNPRHHPVAAFQPESGDGKVGAARFRVARDDNSRGDIGRRLALEPARHGQQLGEIGCAVEDLVLHRAVLDGCRRDRARDRRSAVVVERLRCYAEREREARSRIEDVADDGEPRPVDGLEELRRTGVAQPQDRADLELRIDTPGHPVQRAHGFQLVEEAPQARFVRHPRLKLALCVTTSPIAAN